MCPHMASSSGCHRRRSFFTAACLEVPSRAESVPRGLWWQSVVPSSPQSHLPPSCLVRTIPAASFPQDSLHPRSVIPARDVHVPFPSTGVTAPVTCAQLSLGRYSFIPGSLLCRGRCSCSHQLGSWPGASLTHLHSHEKDWGKIVCKQQKKNCLGFSRGEKK